MFLQKKKDGLKRGVKEAIFIKLEKNITEQRRRL